MKNRRHEPCTNAPLEPGDFLCVSPEQRCTGTLRKAALDGIGIALLPTWAVAEPLRKRALRRVLDAWELPTSTIYAVYPGNRLMSMKVRAFVDHLARCFGRTPYWDESL